MTQDIALFKAMNARMNYDTQRQKVLSENVSNADTPNYRPGDLKKYDFANMLGDLAGSQAKLRPAMTSPMHMSLTGGKAADPKNAPSKMVYEIKPGGNGVDLEEQMVKQTQNGIDYNLMTSLYQKNMAMMKTAIGQ